MKSYWIINVTQRIISWVTFHRWAVVLALAVGIISVAPQLIFSVYSPNYKGIQMFGADAEDYYVARINDVYEGHFLLGDVFSPHKDKPFIVPPLGEILIAGLGKTLSLDAVSVVVFSKFLFPILLFLLIYFLVYEIFISKDIAIISAAFILLGDNLLSNKADIVGLVTFTSSSTNFLSYTRPINPEVSSLFLFGSLYLLWKMVQDRSEQQQIMRKSIAFGIISGLSIYVYIYTWSFLVVVLSLCLAYAWLKEKTHIPILLVALATHIIVTVPYWMNFLKAKAHPEYLDTTIRLGAVTNHAPVWGIWILFSTIVVFWLWPKRYTEVKWFFAISVLSLWVVMNQQIITGVMVQPGHYHWYIMKPFVSIFLAVFFMVVLQRITKNKKAIALSVFVLIGVFIHNAILVQFVSYRSLYVHAVENQRYAPLVSYLKEQYAFSKTVWSNTQIASVIPMYTIHNAPHNNFASDFLNSKEYFIKMFFLNYKLQGTEPEAIRTVLQKDKANVAGLIFGKHHPENSVIPQEIFTGLERQYSDFYHLSYQDIFRYFDIDFIVWDKRYDRDILYEGIPALKKTKEIGQDFIVYKL